METRSKRRRERMKRFNLDTMPDVVMAQILKDCNYADFQSLRKSCSGLRKTVDLVKPDPKIKSIRCNLNHLFMELHLKFVDGRSTKVYYDLCDEGCVVGEKPRELFGSRFFTNATAAGLLRDDFKILKDALINQRYPLEQFTIVIDDFQMDSTAFQDSIAGPLAELPPLRATSVDLGLCNCRHFLHILPLVSPDAIEDLEIGMIGRTEEVVNLEEIAESPHWRNLKSLDMDYFPIDDPMVVASIPRSLIRLRQISSQQAARLKNTFQISATFEHCTIGLNNVDNRTQVLRSIVPDIEDDPDETKWFFTSHRPGKVLKIGAQNRDSFNRMTFAIVDVASLEEDGIVRN